MDEEDAFNDETFGDNEEEWIQPQENTFQSHRTDLVALPDFFKTQNKETNFVEEALEDDPSLSINMVSDFPTARQYQDQQESQFFFLDTENEANATLDSQMESMFELVLNDDEDLSTGYSRNKGPNVNTTSLWNRNSSMSNVIVGSPTTSLHNDNTWSMSASPKQHQNINRNSNFQINAQDEVISSPSRINNNNNNTPFTTINGIKVPTALSLEELEARMNVNAPHQQQIQQQQHQQLQQQQYQLLQQQQQQLQHHQYQLLQQQQQQQQHAMIAPPPHGHMIVPPVNNNNNNNTTPKMAQYAFPQYRPKWKESKKYMTSEEIDSIIRMQDAQLINNANTFAEDYYFIQLYFKRQQPDVFINHKPLFESSPRNTTTNNSNNNSKKGTIELEGVLGRIPSHSVRAPRMLLQLTNNNNNNELTNSNSNDSTDINGNTTTAITQTSSRAIQSVLLSIENAFSCLLDIEDIDSILRRPESMNNFNIAYLRQKREEITNELFKIYHVIIPQFGPLPQRQDDVSFLFAEDEVLINMCLINKGKKLLCRSFSLLFPYQLFGVLFVYMRNLYLIVTHPRFDTENEVTGKFFGSILDIINISNVTNTIMMLQIILSTHNQFQIIKILQSKYGVAIIQTLFKRGHDVNLSPFSRGDIVPPEIPIQQLPPLVQAGLHWKENVYLFFNKMQLKFAQLFTSKEVAATTKIWEFFAVLLVNINQDSKKQLINELLDIIKASPVTETLKAFLYLANEPIPTNTK